MLRLLRSLTDLLLPPMCLACDGLIASGDNARLICRRCRSQLRAPPPPLCHRCGAPRLVTGRIVEGDSCSECAEWPSELVTARSAFLMIPPADRIVHQLKYRGWATLAEAMAAPMARAITPEMRAHIDLVTAVPTTSTRMRERGYNQAALIARAVARLLDREFSELLERSTSKNTQTTLQPAARGANVAGAFRSAAARAHMRGARVLVVDDVLTTGATAVECTRVLLAADAQSTAVLTYARAYDTRRLLSEDN